jgi:hypothetical protein
MQTHNIVANIWQDMRYGQSSRRQIDVEDPRSPFACIEAPSNRRGTESKPGGGEFIGRAWTPSAANRIETRAAKGGEST